MEVKSLCSNCIGPDKCNKYCVLQIGTNLINFINGVDVVETEIGEFKTGTDRKKMEFIVSGHMVENNANPILILSDLTTSIDASGKFTQCGGFSTQQILRMYLNTLKITKETKDNVLELFKKFNSSRLLPVPLKPGAECTITCEENGFRVTDEPARISVVRWLPDKKTGKLECSLICSLEKKMYEPGNKSFIIPIIEYGTSIRLPQIERTLKSSEMDRELIKMTDVGFIKPITVVDSKFTLGIDGQYLYRVTDNKVFIIGVWKNGTIIEFQNGMDPIKKSDAYKKIKNGLGYIDKHRRFIVPYGLFDTNKIVL